MEDTPQSASRLPNPLKPLAEWTGSDERPWPLYAAIIVAILGVALVWLGYAWSRLPIGLFGLALAGLGLKNINVYVKRAAEAWFLYLGVGGVLAGLALVWWAFESSAVSLAAIGVTVAVVSILPLSSALALLARSNPTGFVRWGLGVVTGSVLVAAIPDVPLWAGLVGILAGSVMYRSGLEVAKFDSPNLYSVSGGSAALAGVVLIVFGVYVGEILIAVVGAIPFGLGMTTVSEAWPLYRGKRRGRRAKRDALAPIGATQAIAIGAALLYLGYLAIDTASGLPFVFYAWIALVLVAVGASFVLEFDGFVLAVALGFGLIWVLAGADTPTSDPQVEPEAKNWILALGDSYSSGEGATSYFPGTNVSGEDQNECRRAPTAYPVLVAEELSGEWGLHFFACSGAKAREVWEVGQMSKDTADDPPGNLPQLANLESLPGDQRDIGLVLLTIGGNDAGFGEIALGCLLPGACDVFREEWLQGIDQIGPEIERAFGEIREEVGGDTPIVALPYPMLVSADRCEWSAFTETEHEFLAEFITVLDEEVRTAAARAGVNFFEPGLFAFDGGRICEDGGSPTDAYVNFIALGPTDGSAGERVNPRNWTHGSMHPKPVGHRKIADVLVPWLEQLLDEIELGRPANPEPAKDLGSDGPDLGRASTVLIDPLGLRMPDNGLGCEAEDISPFATHLVRFGDGAIPVDASAGEPFCYTRGDGRWAMERPTDEAHQVLRVDGDGIAFLPELPSDGYLQYFTYLGIDGEYHLVEVEFCAANPDCSPDLADWQTDQVLLALGAVLTPGLLLLIGAWLVALGAKVRWFPDRSGA